MGGGALIGDPMRKGWDLAVEHLGGKFGGLTPKISYGDDQMKPDVAINVVDKFLSQDKVHFVVGPPWTNLMLAVKDRVLASSATDAFCWEMSASTSMALTSSAALAACCSDASEIWDALPAEP